MLFRVATAANAARIATLHADSWRNSYRGMLSNHFLDHEVEADRLAVWENRLRCPAAGQFVLLAEIDGQLGGFICLFGSADSRYGTLLDNLHIASNLQGKGIGKQLMYHAAMWIQQTLSDSNLYLWVFADNTGAIRFYKRLGAYEAGRKIEHSFGEQPVLSLRYVWDDVAILVERIATSNQ